MNGYVGVAYYPYAEWQTRTPGSRSQSQFELAPYNGQGSNIGAGDMSFLQRDSLYRRSTIQDGHISDADDASPEANIWYGRIPQRIPRRYKTLKKIQLFHGNFVLDSAVPSKLLDMCALRSEREFTHMRYSAATCDPNDFKDAGFTLRQIHYAPRRRTELFIVITMYNETDELFCRSMQGIINNIAHLCKRDRSKTWGKDGWKKVVVCIVSDGRQKINSRTLSVLAAMGAYQEGIARVCVLNNRRVTLMSAKNIVNGKPVTAHIYEYTTQSKYLCILPAMCPDA